MACASAALGKMETFLLRTNISVWAEGLSSTTRPRVIYFFYYGRGLFECSSYLVDENLFYKGLDKTKVHGARLHQSHLALDTIEEPVGVSGDDTETVMDKQHPPYPFDSGNSLLALTRKHNVGFTVLSHAFPLIQYLSQMTIAQIVHDNEVCPS